MKVSEEKLMELHSERDRLLAYAECMEAYDSPDFSVEETEARFYRHGWREGDNWFLFLHGLRTTALSAKGEA